MNLSFRSDRNTSLLSISGTSDKSSLVNTKPIRKFINAVYQSLRKRADTMLYLIDALTVAGHGDSPVALSEEAPFRRKFSEVPQFVRCASRKRNKLDNRNNNIGFRVAVSPSSSYL